MAIREVHVQRFSVTSSKPFDDVVESFNRMIAHPEMAAFLRDIASAHGETELKKVVHEAIGSLGLMEFTHFDIGGVLRKEMGARATRSLHFIVGNPLIMKQMAKFVPDAGAYAPVTILIDERADGVHLSYDRMASLLASYENAEALEVARNLDSQVEILLATAAN